MLSEQENGSDPGAEISGPAGCLGSTLFSSWMAAVVAVMNLLCTYSLPSELHLDPKLLPTAGLEVDWWLPLPHS